MTFFLAPSNLCQSDLSRSLSGNAYANAIAELLLCGETKWQKRLDWACWLQQFENSFYTVSKSGSNQDINSLNKSWRI